MPAGGVVISQVALAPVYASIQPGVMIMGGGAGGGISQIVNPAGGLGMIMAMGTVDILSILSNGDVGMLFCLGAGGDVFDVDATGKIGFVMGSMGGRFGSAYDGNDLLFPEYFTGNGITANEISMLLGGKLEGASVEGGTKLGMLMLYKGALNSTINAQDINTAMFMGETNGLTMTDLDNCQFTSTADAGMLMVMGQVTNGTNVTIGNDSSMVMVTQGLSGGASVNVGHDARMVMVMGGMVGGSTLQVGGTLGFGMLMGGMDNSNVTVTGDANMLMLMGGDIANGSQVTVGGDAGMVFLMGDLLASTMDVNGEARMLFGFGDVDTGSRIEAGDVRMGMVLGDVAGRIVITGNFTGSVMLFKGMQAGGGLQVGGNFDGKLSSFKELLCDVDIAGDMSGDLLATLFGNVTIQGSFSGKIGNTSTKPGTGNTLTVAGGTAGGVVAPVDAFANYVGYPA